MKVIIDSFEDPLPVQGEGFKINGQKYTYIRSDETTLMGKKVGCDSSLLNGPFTDI
jgi:Profilin